MFALHQFPIVLTSLDPVLIFDRLGELETERVVKQKTQRKDDTGKQDRAWLCARCQATVTQNRCRRECNGGFSQRFTNPHGIEFEIGCFDQAEGCRLSGTPSHDWSWFAGYAWRIGVCVGCGAHLGWGFSNASGDVFFGLILDRLLRPDDQ